MASKSALTRFTPLLYRPIASTSALPLRLPSSLPRAAARTATLSTLSSRSAFLPRSSLRPAVLPFHRAARRSYASIDESAERSKDGEKLKLVDEDGNQLRVEPKLSLTFTCTADKCNHRSTHEFSKKSYTKGIVIVQCPSCKNRHLIADHLGWFKESTDNGKLRTIEDLMKAKGEKVRRGRVGPGGQGGDGAGGMEGDVEFYED